MRGGRGHAAAPAAQNCRHGTVAPVGLENDLQFVKVSAGLSNSSMKWAADTSSRGARYSENI